MRVLGIETSCDETGVAIYDGSKGLLAHTLYSQVNLHSAFGGVVPELASRDHVRKLLPLVKQVMHQAEITPQDISGIAYAAGPGLVGALLIGAMFGRSLAWAWNVPAIAIHHLEAHLLAPMLEEENTPRFPFVALLVSGGHTLLTRVEGLGKYRVLGETLDDAAGEAFDKTAKLLGLSYPGGPALANLATKGNKDRFHFPRPMVDRPGLDFSFSGLKTFVLNTWVKSDKSDQTKADIAYAFEEAVAETLVIKCKRALKETNLNQLVVAGGVCANQHLRSALKLLAQKLQIEIFFPRQEFCTDNGAMIAYAGYQQLKAGKNDGLAVNVWPRWELPS